MDLAYNQLHHHHRSIQRRGQRATACANRGMGYRQQQHLTGRCGDDEQQKKMGYEILRNILITYYIYTGMYVYIIYCCLAMQFSESDILYTN
jgi:hypothetical protein